MSEDASVKMPGKVAKIIPAQYGESEKAQIRVDDVETYIQKFVSRTDSQTTTAMMLV
jgi:hypothetical protein